MQEFIKPHIVISKCIEFESCRYNGQIIRSPFVNELKPYVEFQTVCPEVGIGLGIPRDPIRVVIKQGKRRLMQPTKGRDVTGEMTRFSETFLNSLSSIDGFILKSRSPSCGIKDVKIYPGEEHVPALEKSAGFFGETVLNHFTTMAIEDEGRLRNARIKEHFLRKIFLFARFREIKSRGTVHDLVQFHTRNKFLLMSYHQKELRILGQIAAQQSGRPLSQTLSEYERHLCQVFAKAPRCTSIINVLQHCFGYVSPHLSTKEKRYFLEAVDNYRAGRLSLAAVISILKSWMIRFDVTYLLEQSFFMPYPEALMHVEDVHSCFTRDFWK